MRWAGLADAGTGEDIWVGVGPGGGGGGGGTGCVYNGQVSART